MVVNLACLLPQAPLISKELMFYFERQTTTLFFFLFASCILLLLLFLFFFLKILYTRRMAVPYIKIKKEKRRHIQYTRLLLMQGLGGLVGR